MISMFKNKCFCSWLTAKPTPNDQERVYGTSGYEGFSYHVLIFLHVSASKIANDKVNIHTVLPV